MQKLKSKYINYLTDTLFNQLTSRAQHQFKTMISIIFSLLNLRFLSPIFISSFLGQAPAN